MRSESFFGQLNGCFFFDGFPMFASRILEKIAAKMVSKLASKHRSRSRWPPGRGLKNPRARPRCPSWGVPDVGCLKLFLKDEFSLNF